MPLEQKQRDILRLVQRSKPESDGRYRVSKILWPLVNGSLPADLAEMTPDDDGGYLRLTDRGQAVADYL